MNSMFHNNSMIKGLEKEMEQSINTLKINSVSDSERISSELYRAKKRNQYIIQALDVGLFFLDSEYKIQEGYSTALEKILNQQNLKDQNFIEILENKIPEGVINNTQEYLELMFREDLDEEIINEMNPLLKSEFHFENEWGIWEFSKHISFKFNRVMNKGKIDSLICIVKDISVEDNLEKQLKRMKENAKKQMDWLVKILHVEPPLLKEFVYITEYELDKINKILKSPPRTGNYYLILKTLNISMNNIINNVSFLNLNFFHDIAQKFINEINNIKDKSNLDGSDFIPLVVQFQEVQQSLNEIKSIMNKFKNMQNTLRTTRRYESGLLINSINNLIDSLSKKLGKKIHFKFDEFHSSFIPYQKQSLVKELLVVLTRYAIFYSIEKPDERKSVNKNPEGIIEISSFSTKRTFGIKFKHDGKLIHIERLLQKTIESNDINDYDENKDEHKSQLGSEVIKLFFMPSNFPTNLNEAEQSKEVFLNMELAKKKLKIHGGKMKITFTSEQYCEYTISFYKK